MAWSDAARAAAAEARRQHIGKQKIVVMDASTGHHVFKTRTELAHNMKSLRKQIRTTKKGIRFNKANLKNMRYAAKRSTGDFNRSLMGPQNGPQYK